jgi:type III pantothenate kinase
MVSSVVPSLNRRLGIDRVCAAAGAARHGASAVVIIDVGSAITVDLVAGGAYRGGLILAGPGLSLRALGTFTEKLPSIPPDLLDGRPRRFDGTENSMITGAKLGAAGAIREAVRVLRQSLDRPPRVYMTGGAAGIVAPRLPRSWRVDPDLVQKGLYHLWRTNYADKV